MAQGIDFDVVDNRRVAIYARQSVERDNSISIETQIENCRLYTQVMNLSGKIKVYEDKGKSGGNMDRDAFKEMMTDVKKGKISHIIIYKLDRISRSLADFISIWESLLQYNVGLVSTQEHIDTSIPQGEMLLKMLMVFAEFERKCIITRVKDAVDIRSSLGFYMGGNVPYGFELVDCVMEYNKQSINTKKYSPVEAEIEGLKLMFMLYSTGSISLSQLQKAVTEEGIATPNGKAWTPTRLGHIMRNPVYVKADIDIYNFYKERGANIVDDVSRFDGTHALYIYGVTNHDKNLPDWSDIKIVIAPHLGVIDSATWLKCQEILGFNKQITRATSGQRSWISGLVACGQCGHTMAVSKYNDTRYFNCNSRLSKRDCKGTSCPAYVDSIEEYVHNCISTKIRGLKQMDGNYRSENTIAVNELRIKLREIEQQEKKIAEQLLSETISASLMGILDAKAVELDKQRTDIQNKMNELSKKNVAYTDLSPLTRKWRDASYKEKRAVAVALIEKIFIHKDGELEIVWKI